MILDNCLPGVRVVHVTTGRVGQIVVGPYTPGDASAIVRFRGQNHTERLQASELEIAGSAECMAAVSAMADKVQADLIPDGPAPEEMEFAPGMRVVHKPTKSVAVIESVDVEGKELFIRFEANDVHNDVPMADVVKIVEPRDMPEDHRHEGRKRVMDEVIDGINSMTGQMAGSLLTVATINELIGVRKALTRLADVGELIAVLQAQQCVPEKVASKLDPWRNNLLKHMAKRAKRRLNRAKRIAKKKRKPYSPPTITKQVPAQETTV